jgi:molecular chaperone DnaK
MSNLKNIAVGIDLGTTYSAIAYVDEFGQPKIIPNDTNDRITPSVVFFESPTSIIVGKEAKNVLHYEPEKVVSFVKREMGNRKEEVRSEENYGEPKPYDFYGHVYSPEEISALILKKLKQDAENYFGGQEVKDAVITVPAYFSEAQRNATRTAGEMAGFNVLQIINEPTAAAYSYGLDQKLDKTQKVFVFDLGGGTFDVTVLQIDVNGDEKNLRVISTDGDHKLGGKDWDQKIIDYACNIYLNEHGFDPKDDILAYGALIESAETAKISLSKKDKAKVVIKPSDGASMPIEITRETFNEICRDLIERVSNLCTNVLSQSGDLSWKDIDRIILAGGSTRMPMIIDFLQENSGKEIQTNLVNPDECVALGAAFMASKNQIDAGVDLGVATEIIKRKLSPVSISDVLSHSLGSIALNERKEHENFILLHKNQVIPCKNIERFCTVEDNQTNVTFKFTEGESSNPEIVTIIQEATLKIVTQMPAGAPLDVTFEMTKEGMLQVTARDVTNNKHIYVEIDRKQSLSRQEINKGVQKIKSLTVE